LQAQILDDIIGSMEIELKYHIESDFQMNQVWKDAYLRNMAEPGSAEEINMHAAYFDSEDLILFKNGIAFRTRREGERCVATLKRKDDDVGVSGLYVREEINVPVSADASFLSPNPDIFIQSEEGKQLVALLHGKPLVNMFDTVFLRKKFRIDTGNTICEVSLDAGEITNGESSLPISELEIELFSGSREELLEIGEIVRETYNLTPELRSKYSRGRSLIIDKE
jgi:inorganic triphosphatase YgiF